MLYFNNEHLFNSLQLLQDSVYIAVQDMVNICVKGCHIYMFYANILYISPFIISATKVSIVMWKLIPLFSKFTLGYSYFFSLLKKRYLFYSSNLNLKRNQCFLLEIQHLQLFYIIQHKMMLQQGNRKLWEDTACLCLFLPLFSFNFSLIKK